MQTEPHIAGMSVHRTIRERREKLGYSINAFAKMCGVSRPAVQQWERDDGTGTAPSRKHQAKVATALQMTVEEMMGGRPEPYSPRAMRLAQLFDSLDPVRQDVAYAQFQALARREFTPAPPVVEPVPATPVAPRHAPIRQPRRTK